MEPFASATDLEARWKPLSADETARAGVLLAAASRMIRRTYRTVDARIAAGEINSEDVVDVVTAMVKRVMIRSDVEGLESRSETAGPWSYQDKFANPLGNMYMTADDKSVFASVNSGGAFSIDTYPAR
jgi:hypothetical protein